MTRKTLLRIAASLTLFTFVGHTIGVILPPPQDQVEMNNVYNLMKQTIVLLPMGSQKSIATMMIGANICLSILLFLSGLFYLMLASEDDSALIRRQLWLLNISSLAVAITSFFCFFPVPALCTGLAGLLGIFAMKKST
jgi:hypothetical protein